MLVEERLLTEALNMTEHACGARKAGQLSAFPSQQQCRRHGPGTDVYYEDAECPWCAQQAAHAEVQRVTQELLETVEKLARILHGNEDLPGA